jgi:hypothetical protein
MDSMTERIAIRDGGRTMPANAANRMRERERDATKQNGENSKGNKRLRERERRTESDGVQVIQVEFEQPHEALRAVRVRRSHRQEILETALQAVCGDEEGTTSSEERSREEQSSEREIER